MPICTAAQFDFFVPKGNYTYFRWACRLLAINSMPSEARMGEPYSRKIHQGNCAIRVFAEEYLSVYLQYISWMRRFAVLDGARTLDVGCFAGDLIDLLLPEAHADGTVWNSRMKRLRLPRHTSGGVSRHNRPLVRFPSREIVRRHYDDGPVELVQMSDRCYREHARC